MIQFFMPMIPPTVTAQEKDIGRNRKTGKAYLHDTPEITEAKKKLTAYLWQHRPEKPFETGVRLIVKWCFPRGRHKSGEYRITKPDTDNLQKLLKDCMTKCGFWKDDALVCSEITEKFWAEIPGIWIRIEELEQTGNVKLKCERFCNFHCSTSDCPNIQCDIADEKLGFGIAEDMGLERIDCKDCAYNDKHCTCDDCYFKDSSDCPECERGDGK